MSVPLLASLISTVCSHSYFIKQFQVMECSLTKNYQNVILNVQVDVDLIFSIYEILIL